MDESTASTPTAPATSGAPSTSSGETRPTMAQAFAANPVDLSASPADTSTAPEDTATQPADATVPLAADPTAPVTPTPGPLPFERHKAILDGAYRERDAARQEAQALKAQVESPDGQRLRQWAQGYQQDPASWFRQTLSELKAAHPELVQTFRSDVARELATRAPAAEQAQSFEPDIPVYNEQGQMVAQTFSADKVTAIVQRAVNEALQREVGPIKQDFRQRQEQQEVARITKEADTVAASQFEEAKAWPGFLSDPAKGLVDPDLAKAFAEHPAWSLDRCYIETVVPKLRRTEQAQVLDHLKTKAAAASGVNPAGAAVAATHRPTSLLDPSLQWS